MKSVSRNKNRVALGCVLLVVFASLALASELPKFKAPTVDGQEFKFGDILGQKVIVIDFWATYCIQCRPQLDQLQILYKKYRDKGLEVVIVSVDTPQNVSKIKPYFKSREYTFPVILDTDSQIARVLKTSRGLPYTLVVNKKGEIVYQHEGYKKGEEKTLEEKILACMEEPGQEGSNAG
jgi:cytochrome c biogenesis protein CcmG/thiol:disulfide interchange protein DsbE